MRRKIEEHLWDICWEIRKIQLSPNTAKNTIGASRLGEDGKRGKGKAKLGGDIVAVKGIANIGGIVVFVVPHAIIQIV